LHASHFFILYYLGKNPFGGEFTIFAGLEECLKYIYHFRFTKSDVEYLQSTPAMQHCEPAFFDWLLQLDTSQVRVYAMKDGTVAFPRVPLIIVEAPLVIGQLLETTLLTLVNYPSLLVTNAARMVRAAEGKTHGSLAVAAVMSDDNLPAQCSKTPRCFEFGLRRAQGPDGGFSASRYAVMGGFVGTSNVQAGKLLGLSITGTHAHAFVQAYSTMDEVKDCTLKHALTKGVANLHDIVLDFRAKLSVKDAAYHSTHDGELAAFIAYGVAFPHNLMCLVDTYDTLRSGVLNFCLVALALDSLGYKPVGVRLDSGDLAYLSMECARIWAEHANEHPFFIELSIVASNDIDEAVLHGLNKQDHAITHYGIGTNLVTCLAQPALGCVYKLVEIDGKPRMKLSQDIAKVLIPGRKKAYRLYSRLHHEPLLDILIPYADDPPTPGERILCRHPFMEQKRAAATPSDVEALHWLVFDRGHVVPGANRTYAEARVAIQQQLKVFRPDILRYINPTPYKVSVSEGLFHYLHKMWQSETPVEELS
jgi:nicotinate phosphoribosyltransferase